VSRLVGAPPGYVGYDEGGQLTEAVRRRPYAVILLDEIEKAHPEVFNILLQILDDGRLTDNHGRTVSFKNAILVMTSNIAAQYIQEETAGMGEFNRDVLWENLRRNVLEQLRQTLRPEFLNRVDETIVFHSLTKAEVHDIVRLQLERLQKLLVEKDVEIDVSEAAVDHIAEAGYDPTYGARPLKRYISKQLSQQIAKQLLAGKVHPGQRLHIDANEEGLTFAAEDRERVEGSGEPVEA
jgi:ATP-dependent Clp protease ATP-binding subunit ClpB